MQMHPGPRLVTGKLHLQAIRLLAAKRNHRINGKGSARGNQAGERGDRNEQHRHCQDHDRIMGAIFDPATNEAVQSEAYDVGKAGARDHEGGRQVVGDPADSPHRSQGLGSVRRSLRRR